MPGWRIAVPLTANGAALRMAHERQVTVGQYRSLWSARRAGGVKQQREILRACLRRVLPLGTAECLVLTGNAGHSSDPNARQFLRYLGTEDRCCRNLIEDDRSSFRIGQTVVELFGFDPPIERSSNEPAS